MTKQKKRNNRLIIIIAAVVVLLIVAAIIKGRSQQRGEEVEVEKVERRVIVEKVSASGKIFPETEVKISSDVSGEVVELEVEEGDSVKMGQLLARIDPDAYQSAVERGKASVDNAKAQVANARAGIERSKAQYIQAKAQKEQIEAQLENAKAIHQRNEQLKAEKVISDADYDASLSNLRALEANLRSAEANVSSAEASLESAKQSTEAASFNVKSAEASLKELQTNLRRTSIYAPVTGIVSQLNVEQGERVVGTIQMTGTELMRIANMSTMEVQVDVNENDVVRVSLGDPVIIDVDAYLDREFKGVVTEIASSASNAGTVALTTDQVTNFVVKVRISPESYADLISEQNPYPFRPGMSASVDIVTETKGDVLSIPIQSVTTREKEQDEAKKKKVSLEDEELMEVVFVKDGDKVKMVKVQTGIQDDDFIEITEGLSGDEEVVTGPYSAISRKLDDGDQIKIKEEDDGGWGKDEEDE